MIGRQAGCEVTDDVMTGQVHDDDLSLPELDEWPPERLSFHVASMLPRSPMLQQSLLEVRLRLPAVHMRA